MWIFGRKTPVLPVSAVEYQRALEELRVMHGFEIRQKVLRKVVARFQKEEKARMKKRLKEITA